MSVERLGQLYKRKKLLEAFIRSAGWRDLSAEIEAQVRARRQSIFVGRFTDLDSVFAATTLMGEAGGLSLAKALPVVIIADLLTDIEVLEEEIRQKEDEKGEG